MLANPKSAKRQSSHFTLLGSARTKAAQKNIDEIDP